MKKYKLSYDKIRSEVVLEVTTGKREVNKICRIGSLKETLRAFPPGKDQGDVILMDGRLDQYKWYTIDVADILACILWYKQITVNELSDELKIPLNTLYQWIQRTVAPCNVKGMLEWYWKYLDTGLTLVEALERCDPIARKTFEGGYEVGNAATTKV